MQDQTVPQNFLVTFDPLAGVDPLKIPAPAKTSEIADRIQAAFEAIDISVGVISINLAAGTVAVEDTDGDVIERARIEGPGVGEQASPHPGPSYFAAVDELQESIRELMSRCVDDPRGYVALVAAKSGALAYEQRKFVAPRVESEQTDPQRPRRGRVIAEHLEYIASLFRGTEIGELPTSVSLRVSLSATASSRDVGMATVEQVAKLTGQPAHWGDSGGEYGHYQTELSNGRAWTLSCHTYEKRPVSTEDELRARVAELEAQLATGGAR